MPKTPERLIEIATRHISHNERLKSHNIKEYSDFLGDMKNSVTNQLANKDLTKFSRERLLALEKNIASDLKEINQAAAGTLKSQAKGLAKYESQFEAKALADVVDHSFNVPSTSQLNSAVFKTPLIGIEGPMKGKLLDGIIKDWSDRTVNAVNSTISAGYYQGKTTAAIVKDVVGTGANFTGGSLRQVKRDTEGLVRTSLQHAANQARQETWNQNSDVVKGVRILATLDSKTSTICRSLDNQVYPIDSGPRPPFHINCRTTTVAALDERFKILDEDATRSARDPETGDVYKTKSSQSYYGWLKGQPANVQDSIIGPTRGKLLRNGGLTPKRFAELQLSKNFQPMTLAEMKAIEPIAFEKAGIDITGDPGKKPIKLRYSPKKTKVASVPVSDYEPPTPTEIVEEKLTDPVAIRFDKKYQKDYIKYKDEYKNQILNIATKEELQQDVFKVRHYREVNFKNLNKIGEFIKADDSLKRGFQMADSWQNSTNLDSPMFFKIKASLMEQTQDVVYKSQFTDGWGDLSNPKLLERVNITFSDEHYLKIRAFNQAFLEIVDGEGATYNLYRGTDGKTGKKMAKAIKPTKQKSFQMTDSSLAGYTSDFSIADDFGANKKGISLQLTFSQSEIIIPNELIAGLTNKYIKEKEWITLGINKKVSIDDIKFRNKDGKAKNYKNRKTTIVNKGTNND